MVGGNPLQLAPEIGVDPTLPGSAGLGLSKEQQGSGQALGGEGMNAAPRVSRQSGKGFVSEAADTGLGQNSALPARTSVTCRVMWVLLTELLLAALRSVSALGLTAT